MELSKIISKSKPTQDDIQIEVRELLNQYQAFDATNEDAHENDPKRKIVLKGKKENDPIFQNSKKLNRKTVPKLEN